MENFYRISGFIQPYAWGGKNFISELLGQSTPSIEPQAELWMGAHPKGPSEIHLATGRKVPLDQWLANEGQASLGKRVDKEFGGRLPFLFKVLDVKDMLSIQSHPDKAQAMAGFEAEEKLGIPRTAPNRVYRDDNHKPELMLALTTFYLLHGFKPITDIQDILQRYLVWKPLVALAKEGLKPLYSHIMQCPQMEINQLLKPLKEELSTKDIAHLPKTEPDYWASKALSTYARPNGDLDRGILSIYLMNILELNPGEAIFQDAGILHAYLEGVNVEIMANSDNVFRGGLTVKHIAVEELLKHVILEDRPPYLVHPRNSGQGELIYPTPAPDFELAELILDQENTIWAGRFDAPTIWLVLSGEVHLGDQQDKMKRGDQFFVPANTQIALKHASHEETRLVRAGLPNK